MVCAFAIAAQAMLITAYMRGVHMVIGAALDCLTLAICRD
jgi:hypothetical protein